VKTKGAMANPNGRAPKRKTLLSHTKRRYFLKATGEHFRTDLGLVFPPEEKFLALRQFILTFLAKTSVTARHFHNIILFKKGPFITKHFT
jgi:hypothetical protein